MPPTPCKADVCIFTAWTVCPLLRLKVIVIVICQSLAWSGDHRVNVGAELLYSQTRLSVTGQPAYYCSFTLGLINSSSAHSTNLTLFTEVGTAMI